MIVQMKHTVPMATDEMGYERVTLAEGCKYEVSQEQGENLVRSGHATVIVGSVLPVERADGPIALPGTELAPVVSEKRIEALMRPRESKPAPRVQRAKKA